MSKKPICNVNHSYTGNVHLPHTQAEDFSVWLTSQAEKSFVVTEVGSDNKQHLHYFCENLDIQAETFKKNLRTKYPELKKTGKGGANKYVLNLIKEELQFYYLFKESEKETFKFISNYYNVSDKYIKKNNKKYLKLKEINKLGAAGKFYQFCIEKKVNLSDTSSLIESYINYSVEKNRKQITAFDCEKHINYILARESPTILIENWKLKFKL